jgi:hypothetical protein
MRMIARTYLIRATALTRRLPILFLGPKTFTGTEIDNGLVFFGGIVFIGLYIAGIAIGAVLGAWGGLILARKVNARTGL